MKMISIEFDGQTLSGHAERIGDKLWLHFQGRTWVEEASATGRKKKSGAGAATHPGVILAPMPGKVTKLFVAEGDSVAKGDALLVMEAMKMEYTLKSDIDGQVGELKASEGDQVTLGQKLVHIQEKE